MTQSALDDNYYSQAVRRAQAIVTRLKTPKEFRAIAFQTLLQHLLDTGSGPPMLKHVPEKPPESKAAKEALTDRIGDLQSEGFFREPKGAGEIVNELKNRGFYHSFASVGMALLSLVRRRELRRVATKKGGKTQFLYTNP